jgi:exonuclease SbcD
MKILHTGDWHIGRTLNQHSLLEDQAFALDGLLTILDREHPDVLLIAGDLYDRAVPSRDAMRLVDHTLTEILLKKKIPIIIIGGNHDGRERMDFANDILRERGLYIVGQFTPAIDPIILNSPDGPVAFWPVPFIKPVEYRDITHCAETPDYNGMYEAILKDITIRHNPVIPNVLITHGLVLSGVPKDGDIDESVRPIEIGGISYARSELFTDFDYVALGHLHRPQKVGCDSIRYAGSLLKYSFSEIHQKKSVTLVDVKKDTPAQIRTIPLPFRHDLRVITGEFDELTGLAAYTHPDREDYLRIILTNRERVPNPMEELRCVYPNIMEMGYENAKTRIGGALQENIKKHLSDPMALFLDFYQTIHGEEPTPEQIAFVKQSFNAIKEEDHATA